MIAETVRNSLEGAIESNESVIVTSTGPAKLIDGMSSIEVSAAVSANGGANQDLHHAMITDHHRDHTSEDGQTISVPQD